MTGRPHTRDQPLDKVVAAAADVKAGPAGGGREEGAAIDIGARFAGIGTVVDVRTVGATFAGGGRAAGVASAFGVGCPGPGAGEEGTTCRTLPIRAAARLALDPAPL